METTRGTTRPTVTGTTDSPPIFLAGTLFTTAELCAMRIDGLVVRIYGDAYAGITVPDSPALRAAALLAHAPPALAARAALSRLSACWVHGCAPRPTVIDLVVDSSRRTTSRPPLSGCAVHEAALGQYDVVHIGAVPVTSPLRSAVDVALFEAPAVAGPVLSALAGTPRLRCPLTTVRAAIRVGTPAPGRRSALALVDRLIEEEGD